MREEPENKVARLYDLVWSNWDRRWPNNAVAALYEALDENEDEDRVGVWYCIEDLVKLGLGTNRSLFGFYARWKAENGNCFSVEFAFARAFRWQGLARICDSSVERAQRFASTGADFVALAEFVHDERRQPAIALDILDRGLEVEPRSPYIWDAIADIHRTVKSDRQSAMESFFRFKSTRLGSETEEAEIAWASFGWMLGELGDYGLAEDAYRTALDIRPNYIWAMNKLAGLLRKRFARYGEALKLAQQSVGIEPDRAWSWYLLGYIYQYDLGRYPEALKAYRRALEIDPHYTQAWESLAVILAWQSNDPTGAEEAFNKAFRSGEASAFAYNHYGIFLREKTDRYLEAEKSLQTAISMEPDKWWHRLALAVLYEKRFRRYTDARKLLLEAKALSAPVNDIDYRLALLVQRHRAAMKISPN